MGDKLPGPMKAAFDKAMELAAYAPLLPIIEKIKSKDLQGAAEQVMSAGMLKVTQNLDTELPRKILKSVLQNKAVTTAVQQAQAQMPQLGAQLLVAWTIADRSLTFSGCSQLGGSQIAA